MSHCQPYRPVNPLTGIWAPRRNALYRYASPGGDGWSCGISTMHPLARHSATHSVTRGHDLPQSCGGTSSNHCSLVTAHLSYTFSAKERDSETGLSYFGARYYNSDLSIWLSVDPMSDKYASLSPYVYCADNPIKLVDPNGDTIFVGDNYYYLGEQLYNNQNHSIFTPDVGSFEYLALTALNTLFSTSQGKELMSPFLSEQGPNVKIVRSSKSRIDDVETEYGTKKLLSLNIYWNYEGKMLLTTDGAVKNGITDLGHEFSHAFDAIGNIKYVTCEYPENVSKDNKIHSSEWMAVYRENLIRKELGLPYRTYYKSIEDSWHDLYPKGPYMLKDGEPYMPQELISH